MKTEDYKKGDPIRKRCYDYKGETNEMKSFSYYADPPIVFTNGCFDVIHAGHIHLLREASKLGNLIVGVNSDRSVSMLKKGRPIHKLESRMDVIASIRYVWQVVSFDEETPEALIRSEKPDILVKGSDYEGKVIAGAEFVEKVVLIDLLPGFSTTDIVKRVGDFDELLGNYYKTPVKGEN